MYVSMHWGGGGGVKDQSLHVHVLVEPCSGVPVVTQFEKEHTTKRDIVGLITQNFLNFNIFHA